MWWCERCEAWHGDSEQCPMWVRYGGLEPIRRTYDADELGIDQEDD